MSQKPSLRRRIGEWHCEWAQALLKCGRHHLQDSYWSLRRQLGWKKSVLLTCKVQKVFVNALSAHDKYSLRNRDNLTQPIQRQLSQKQGTFAEFFFAFLECTLNFKHFPRKGETHSWCISEITDTEKRS